MIDERTNVRSLFEKNTRSSPVTTTSALPSCAEPESEYTAYAQGRISRHSQLSLMFRHADGSVRVFAYAYLCGAASADPQKGFELDFSVHKVKVTGRNLEMLLRLICQHRVAEIREAERTQIFIAADDMPVVEQIKILSSKDLS